MQTIKHFGIFILFIITYIGFSHSPAAQKLLFEIQIKNKYDTTIYQFKQKNDQWTCKSKNTPESTAKNGNELYNKVQEFLSSKINKTDSCIETIQATDLTKKISKSKCIENKDASELSKSVKNACLELNY